MKKQQLKLQSLTIKSFTTGVPTNTATVKGGSFNTIIATTLIYTIQSSCNTTATTPTMTNTSDLTALDTTVISNASLLDC